jgi:hypothetical protein
MKSVARIRFASRLFAVAAALITLSMTSYAQTVTPEMVEDWFQSRYLWVFGTAAAMGILVALFHLCRLRFGPDEITIKWQARSKFLFWLIAVLILSGIFLLIDIWKLYPFETFIGVTEAFSQVWLTRQTLILLVGIGVIFALVTALTTRLKRQSPCRYALWPW